MNAPISIDVHLEQVSLREMLAAVRRDVEAGGWRWDCPRAELEAHPWHFVVDDFGRESTAGAALIALSRHVEAWHALGWTVALCDEPIEGRLSARCNMPAELDHDHLRVTRAGRVIGPTDAPPRRHRWSPVRRLTIPLEGRWLVG